MGGDKPLPYKDYRRGGVYPRPCDLELCKRLSYELWAMGSQMTTKAHCGERVWRTARGRHMSRGGWAFDSDSDGTSGTGTGTGTETG
jgi:hypothetical protein